MLTQKQTFKQTLSIITSITVINFLGLSTTICLKIGSLNLVLTLFPCLLRAHTQRSAFLQHVIVLSQHYKITTSTYILFVYSVYCCMTNKDYLECEIIDIVQLQNEKRLVHRKDTQTFWKGTCLYLTFVVCKLWYVQEYQLGLLVV